MMKVAAFLCVAVISASVIAAEKKPNIVIIVADDLGWNTVGFHNGFVKTPNIDRIAREGAELDRFYVSPMCSPTRAGLMTGRYPMRYGMARSVVRPWAKFGLPPEERTLPEALADAGYAQRGAFGKWHLGHLDPKWHPLAQGFTQYKGCYNGALDYFTRNRDGQPDWHSNYDDISEDGYITDLIADSAAKFIREHSKDAPMLCYVAFTAPHDPLQAPKEFVDRYANLDDDPADGKPSEKQRLAGMVACMDDGIGRILKAIDDSGIANDTVVWFTSDNGGIGGIPGNNSPLHGAKLTVYEGGVRVAAAVRWPGVVEAGGKITTPIMNVDVMPTLLSACGAAVQTPAGPLDGRDMLAALKGGASPEPRDLYFFHGQSGPDREQQALTAADGWKLVIVGPDLRLPGGYKTPQHRVELFRLAEDPLEKTDLAEKEPQRVAAMAEKLIAFRKSEPETSLAPTNRKPDDFEPPAKWHNAPLAAKGG